MRPLIIGIAGGTGSGKTTLVENLKEQFGADISVPEGGKNLVALMMIVQRIAYHIEHGDVVDEQ